MSVEDKMLAVRARHAIAKSTLDISELTISCSRGMVELNGKVKAPRSVDGNALPVAKEFRRVIDMVRAVHGVKEVYHERVRIID